MRFTSLAATAMMAFSSTALAATASVQNLCPETVYITIMNSTQKSVEYAIAANGTYSQPLTGTGNSLGVTKVADYYTTSAAKFIFAFTDSTADGLIYWSVTSKDGDAFEGQSFRVQPADATCALVSGYDGGQVHTCSDTKDIAVILC